MSGKKKDTGVVNIHGKEYLTVSRRIADFREKYPDYTIVTDLVESGDVVVMKATISEGERILSTGYAEEVRGSTNINKTSALENCETSAVGRALAFFGLAGTEIASADEVANAIEQQNKMKVDSDLIAYNALVKKHIYSIAVIKEAILNGDLSTAIEAFSEISDDDKKGLWKADSKGGIFTTKEVSTMKSNEWAAERNAMNEAAA